MKQKKQILLFLILYLSISIGYAQEKVENINSTLKNNKIIITYDLVNMKFNQVAYVDIFYSTDDGKTFVGPLEKVSGDVGTGVTKGTGKKITWDPIMEQVYLSGSERVIFRIQAEVETQKIQRKFFVSYLGNINTPFGISLGFLGKTSFYMSGRVNHHLLKTADYNYIDNFVQDYEIDKYYVLTGKYVLPEYDVSAGVNFQVSPAFFIYSGGGYFSKDLLWELGNYNYLNDDYIDDSWVKNLDKAKNGAFVEAGCIIKIKERLLISAGATSDFKYINWTAGLGICL